MNKICVAFFLFLPIFILAQDNTLIAEKEIDIALTCGYANKIDQKDYVSPITITIKNNSTKISKGILRVVQPRIHSITSEERVYEQTIVLSGKSTKVLKFYMFLRSDYYRLDVTFFREDDSTIYQEFDLDVVNMNMPFWIHWKSKVEKIKLNKNTRFFYVESAIQAFPEHLIFLKNVFVMSVDSISDLSLNTQQLGIFKDWLSQGGKLVIFNTVGVESLVRKELAFMPSLELPTIGYNESNKKTLEAVAINSFGLGKVFCFYNSQDNEYVKKIFDNDFFVKDQLFVVDNPVDNSNYNYNYGYRVDSFTELLKKNLVGEIDLGWMVLLLLGYLFCIGPLDYMLTKMFKKRMLTWFIYIASIIVFSFLAYAKGYILKSGPMKVQSYNFVDINSDKEMTGVSIFGVYSTRNTTYEVTSSMSRSIFLPFNNSTSSEELFQSISSQSILKTRIPIYSAKNYTCAWSHRFDDSNKISIAVEGKPDIVLDVPSSMKVVGGHIVTPTNYYDIKLHPEKWIASQKRRPGEFKPQGSSDNYFLFFSTTCTNSGKSYLKDPTGSLLDLTSNIKDYILVLLFVETDEKFVDIQGESAVHNSSTVLRYILPPDYQ